MDRARIAELLTPFLGAAQGQRLTTEDLHSISTYIDILLRWNARINLTAIRDPEEIVTRHFGESLFAARTLFPHREHLGIAALGRPCGQRAVENSEGHGVSPAETGSGQKEAFAPEGSNLSAPAASALLKQITIADVGSGAGFPGLPIKLWQPQISLVLIESNQKKATFLREVARVLRLTSVDILAARAESLTTNSFDVVTLRAVESFESVLVVAAGLVAPGGRFALLIGSAQLAQAGSILRQVPGYEVEGLAATSVPLSRSRVLAICLRSR